MSYGSLLDKKWDRMYAELVEFKRQRCHTNVPQRWPENPSLGAWVSSQRDGSRGGEHLSLYRRNRLNELSFRWEKQADSHERAWDEKFKRLKAYKTVHGDCMVPHHYPEDQQLGYWAGNQQMKYKRKTLSQERIDRLESIGFEWIKDYRCVWTEDRDNAYLEKQWMENYQALVDYYNEHGHSIVPNTFVEGKNESFGRWIRSQRTAFAEKRLTRERRKLLDRVNFVYQIDATDAKRSLFQRQWDEMLDKLVAFQVKHGPFRVPGTGDDGYKDLYWWVVSQKGQRRTMDPQRAQRLDNIGFWQSRPAFHKRCWEARLRQLKRFKNRFGTTVVASTQNLQLANWTRNQRYLKTKGELDSDRERRLTSMGFEWTEQALMRPRMRSRKDSGASPQDTEEVNEDCVSDSSDEDWDSVDEYESEGEELIVGLKVGKFFEGRGFFSGVVVAKDDQYFRVRYEDGDEEELDEQDLRGVLVRDANEESTAHRKSPPRSRKRARCPIKRTDARPKADTSKKRHRTDCLHMPSYPFGTKVRKYFRGHGWFEGKIVAFDEKDWYYKVRFDDGDEEEYTENELERIVVDILADESSAEADEKSDATKDLSSSDSPCGNRMQLDHGEGGPVDIDRRPDDQDRLANTDNGIVIAAWSRYAIGTPVRKFFRGHGWFCGEIVAFDDENLYYKVRFEDGDEEEYTEAEMTRIVVRKNVSVRSETKICTADGERAVEDVANEPIMDQNVSRSIVKGMTRTQSIHTLTGDKPLESSVAMTVSYHGLVGRQVRKHFAGHGWFTGRVNGFAGDYCSL